MTSQNDSLDSRRIALQRPIAWAITNLMLINTADGGKDGRAENGAIRPRHHDDALAVSFADAYDASSMCSQ